MDPCSVGREVKPEVRVVTMTVVIWFVVRYVMGIAVVRIVMMVSVNPVVVIVVVPEARPSTAITCLRWRRPYDQKHYQKSGFCNLTDIFHCYSPFIRIGRRGEEKGYGWVEKEKRSHH
mgnify:FL=1